jgi:predicted Zn-dependent protease
MPISSRSLPFPFWATVLALILAVTPLAGQKSGGTSGGSRTNVPTTMPPDYHPTNQDNEFKTYDVKRANDPQVQKKNDAPACFHWPMSPVQSGTVSVNRMEIPAKAREEFDQACAAYKNDLNEAQKHLNKAVKIAPQFAAAWVLLGQIQQDQKKPAQAEEFCAQGRAADPNYLPSYLCLADAAAHQEKWSQVADLTSQAAALHPVRAPGAFYYNCLANFYLSQWTDAEKSGLRAIDDAGTGQLPQLHWLLAKVYEQKGERVAEAAQIREFLKLAPHDPDAETARQVLTQIEGQTNSGVSDKK